LKFNFLTIACLLCFYFQIQNCYADDKNNLELAKSILADELKAIPKPKISCLVNFEVLKKRPLGQIESKENDQKINVSVLTLPELNSLFAEIIQQKNIAFELIPDGCFVRAYSIAHFLEDKGIISGKAFIEGYLPYEIKKCPSADCHWNYHVASFVLVKQNGKNLPYVIDPTLANRPLTYAEWKAVVTKNPKARVDVEYFTNRFAFTWNDKDENFKDWNKTNEHDYLGLREKSFKDLELLKKLGYL
jgi:hypothetical protein